MKTKIFTYNTGGDFLIIAIAIHNGDRLNVNFCFSNSSDTVYPSYLEGIDFTDIKKYAAKNNIKEIISIIEL